MAAISKSAFLNEVHAMRGLTMLMVVALHAQTILSQHLMRSSESGFSKIFSDLYQVAFHDSTLLFALISGILFSRVMHSAGWSVFFRRRVQHVLLPYLLLTIVFTLTSFDRGSGVSFQTEDAWSLLIENALSGSAQFTFWYIPLALLLFASTPVLVALLNSQLHRYVAFAYFALPLVFSREATPITLSTYAYFLGAYGVGLYLGRNYEAALVYCHRFKGPFFLTFLASSGLLFWMTIKGLGQFEAVDMRESLFWVQKLAIAMLALQALRNIRPPAVLHHIADKAFAIYFLHSFSCQSPHSWFCHIWRRMASGAGRS